MDRRSFIKQTGTVIAGAALVPFALPETGAQTDVSTTTGRHIFSMNRNWRQTCVCRFRRGDDRLYGLA